MEHIAFDYGTNKSTVCDAIHWAVMQQKNYYSGKKKDIAVYKRRYMGLLLIKAIKAFINLIQFNSNKILKKPKA